MPDEFDIGADSDKLRALSEARSALENVDREHREVLAELSRWRGKFEQLVDALRGGAVRLSFDRDGKLSEVSSECEDTLGMTPDQFVELFETEVADETTLAKIRKSVDGQLTRGAEVSVIDIALRGAGGRTGSFQLVHVPVIDEEGEVVGVEGIARPAGATRAGAGEPDANAQFEEIMEGASRRLFAGMTEHLEETLGEVAGYFGVDRCTVSRYDEDERVFSSLRTWSREGVSPSAEAQSMPISKLPWAYAALGAGEPVVIPSIDELPQVADVERQLLGQADIQAALFAPILSGGSLEGFVSLQLTNQRRDWSEGEVLFARRFASNVAAALSHDALMSDLEEAKTVAEEAAAMLEELGARAEDSSKDVEQARSEADEARQRLDETHAAADSVREELDRARRELDEARREADEARRQLEEAEAATAELQRQVEAAQAEVKRERDRAEQFAADAEELQEQLAEVAVGDFDPDATIKVGGVDFDPDATLETDAVIERPEDELGAEGDRPRALELDEILERTRLLRKKPSTTSRPRGPREAAGRGSEAPELKAGELHEALHSPVEEVAAEEEATVGEETIEVDLPSDLVPAEEPAADEFDTGEFEIDEAEDYGEPTVPGFTEMAADEGVAPAPEAPESDSEQAIPLLAGLDVEAGLAEVGRNSELYRNLLVKFRQDYRAAGDKIGAAMEKDNLEVAHLLVHAIRGVAGNIGAHRVHDSAEDLETAMIDRDPAHRAAALDAFCDALSEVIESIAGLESGEGIPTPSADESAEGHLSDPAVLRSYLEGLRQHLEAEKPKQCQLVMREIGARTWPSDLNVDVEQLADLIGGDRFDEAKTAFKALLGKLG